MSNITTRKQYAEYIRQVYQLPEELQASTTAPVSSSKQWSRLLGTSWSYRTNLEIGMYLIYQAIHTWTIPNATAPATATDGKETPAFSHNVRQIGPSRLGCIGWFALSFLPHSLTHSLSFSFHLFFVEWHPMLYDLLVNQPKPLVLEPWSLPMLVPPKPWLTYNNGGYLLHSTNCVRLRVSSIPPLLSTLPCPALPCPVPPIVSLLLTAAVCLSVCLSVCLVLITREVIFI
jgi:hypothetical protein